jgi:hypothetical protein
MKKQKLALSTVLGLFNSIIHRERASGGWRYALLRSMAA